MPIFFRIKASLSEPTAQAVATQIHEQTGYVLTALFKMKNGEPCGMTDVYRYSVTADPTESTSKICMYLQNVREVDRVTHSEKMLF